MRNRLLTLALIAGGLSLMAAGTAQAHPKVSLTLRPKTADLGQRVRFKGHARGAVSGTLVQLQERVRRRWKRVIRTRTQGPKFAFKLGFHNFGRLRLRVAVAGRGHSRIRKLTVLDVPVGIHKIKHVVVIMQENRSFDSYFGTYPGADGIPPGACVPDPATGACVAPYHDTNNVNAGGPHGAAAARADLNNGAMNGFVGEAEGAQGCVTPGTPACQTDVMGYHDGSDIPNYWDYARNFVLQDHLFEPNASWSLPMHLFMVSEWSARCTTPDDPFSCTNALDDPGFQDTNPNDSLLGPQPVYAWTDMTYLMHRAGVSWGYFVKQGVEPDCANGAERCPNAPKQGPATPGIWNPLPDFDTVQEDRQQGNVQDVAAFLEDARLGNLPNVSWVIPSQATSEHPPASVFTGQSYVTNLVNKIMSGPDWSSTAIFLSWDDWGGFYDHVVPPVIDGNGYGFRAPGLVISPYAKQGFIDHHVLSHDAYNKFIEDDFLASQRLNPANDGRPDPRPDVREAAPQLGTMTRDFDFHQKPRAPMILPKR